MYAFDTSTREISKYFEREFDTRLSAETISAIKDRVLPEIKEWKIRMSDSVYAICWLDAILHKVKDDAGCAVSRAIYNVFGITRKVIRTPWHVYIKERMCQLLAGGYDRH